MNGEGVGEYIEVSPVPVHHMADLMNAGENSVSVASENLISFGIIPKSMKFYNREKRLQEPLTGG